MNFSFSDISKFSRLRTPDDISKKPFIILKMIFEISGKRKSNRLSMKPEKTEKKITKLMILSIDIPPSDMLWHMIVSRDGSVLFFSFGRLFERSAVELPFESVRIFPKIMARTH